MSDYSKLQELAEGANAVTGDVHVEMTITSDAGPNQAEIDAVTAFMEAATPAAVLALLAEIDRLRTAEGDAMTYKAGMENVAQQRDQLKAECEESAAVIDRLAKILAGVAVALKGEELPLHRHGYQDLAELVGILKLENDLRAAENETLRKSLTDIRENSSDLGACECAADALADSRKKAIQ